MGPHDRESTVFSPAGEATVIELVAVSCYSGIRAILRDQRKLLAMILVLSPVIGDAQVFLSMFGVFGAARYPARMSDVEAA